MSASRWTHGGVVCGACSLLLLLLVAVPGAAGRMHATSMTTQDRAHAEAKRLLGLVQLPANATRSSTEPAGDRGLLADPTYNESTPNLVDDYAWWTVPGSASGVLTYVKAHLPSAAQPYVTAEGGNVAPGIASDAFSLAPIAGVLSERVLGVTLLQPNRDVTAVRTDGEAVWITTKPSWERIPTGVERATFVETQPDRTRRRRPTSTRGHLTGHNAQLLVHLINNMRLVQPGSRNCPKDDGATVRLRFLGSAGRLIARAVEHPTGCAYLSLTVGRRTGPALNDDPSVTDKLEQFGLLKQNNGLAPLH